MSSEELNNENVESIPEENKGFFQKTPSSLGSKDSSPLVRLYRSYSRRGQGPPGYPEYLKLPVENNPVNNEIPDISRSSDKIEDIGKNDIPREISGGGIPEKEGESQGESGLENPSYRGIESWSGDHSYRESQSGDCSYGESGVKGPSCIKRIGDFFKSIPPSWKHVILVFIIIRILASTTAIVGNATVPSNVIVAAEGYSKPSYIKGWELVAGVWERSDALWYIHLAKDGYSRDSQGTVFMPLYPLLIRLIHYIPGMPWLICALLISNICFFFALYFLYRLCEIEKDRETAERAVWYQALYPGSLFLLAPYTESLFLMLATGAFLAARTRRWWLAAIAGALLGTTRNMGALIIIPLIIEFIRQRREEKPIPWKNAAWLLIIPLGILSVMAFQAKLTGDPLSMVHRQDNWQRTFMLPWETLYHGFRQAINLALDNSGGLYIMEAVIVSAALVLGIVSFFKIPLPYGIFIWMNLLPPLFAPFRGRMLMSCIRFVAVIFPLFMVLAVLSKPKYLDQAVKLLFAAFYGLSVALYVSSQGMF